MSYDTQNLVWAHASADTVVAASCVVISAAFLVFALRNRGARLGWVLGVFAFLFAAGGVTHVCEVGGWYAAGAVFKWLTALACAAAAVLTVKCLPAARTMFARAAVIERKAGERIQRLRTDPRYDTPQDREAQAMLSEIKELARLAREVYKREEA